VTLGSLTSSALEDLAWPAWLPRRLSTSAQWKRVPAPMWGEPPEPSVCRMTIRGILISLGLAATVAGLSPSVAQADLTPPVVPPKVTAPTQAPLREGFRRTITVTHTCRARNCDIRIFQRLGSATSSVDYLFPYKRPARFLYARGKRFSIRVPVSAVADGKPEPRESMLVFADVRAIDGANVQRVEGRKRVYIVDR